MNKRKDLWHLYILRCKGRTLYTGITNNLDQRLERHNKGKGGSYTRAHLPVQLIYKETYPDRGTALRRELQVKGLNRKAKEKLIVDSHFKMDKALKKYRWEDKSWRWGHLPINREEAMRLIGHLAKFFKVPMPKIQNGARTWRGYFVKPRVFKMCHKQFYNASVIYQFARYVQYLKDNLSANFVSENEFAGFTARLAETWDAADPYFQSESLRSR